MSKVNAETPSKAQQSCVGTDSTKRCDGDVATAGGADRTTRADGTLAGCTPSFAVAFIGESAMRAVSLRGPAGGGGGTRFFAGGIGKIPLPGDGGAGPFGADGTAEVAPGGGTGAFASGGGGKGLDTGAGGSGPCGLAIGGGGGLKPGAGGNLLGGRTAPAEAAGGAAGGGGEGGRAGRVMRTVSFFGSFRSAIRRISLRARERRPCVSQTLPRCQPSSSTQASKS